MTKMSKKEYNNFMYNICEIYSIILCIAFVTSIIVAYIVLMRQPTVYVHAANISVQSEEQEPLAQLSGAVSSENIELTDDLVSYIDSFNDDTTDTESNENTEIFNTELKLEDTYSAVLEWQVYNGDFGVEQLYTLHKYCTKYGVPMELMLSIICCESSFESYALSPKSSAAGYCQIIRDTANWIYEDMLKYGNYDEYNHDYIMTNNWELNLEIGCYLMKYNYLNSYNSWELALYLYHGSTSQEQNLSYFTFINNCMYDLFNISICDLK